MRLVRANLFSSRRRKSCVIVGQDGWDIDVLVNLTFFYASYGFRVFFSKKPEPADLIVIMRFDPTSSLVFDNINTNTPIHIYPYVGYKPEAQVQQIKQFPVSIFAPSDSLLVDSELIFQRIAFPPVYIPFWSRYSEEREFEFVHIGNLKRINGTGTWREAEELIKVLQNEKAHVWGRGWNQVINISNWHGPVGILRVPNIYSRTKYALGLMYPYQIRSRTISGRFWQAPLCGAALVCENSVRQVIPGVYPIGLDNIEHKICGIIDEPTKIQDQAKRFWEGKWSELKEMVTQSLELMPPLETGRVSPRTILYNILWLFAKEGIIYA